MKITEYITYVELDLGYKYNIFLYSITNFDNMDFSSDSDFSFASTPDQKSWLTKKAIPAVKKALPMVQRVLPVVAPFVPALQPVAAVVGAIHTK
jgi:hypothetical protein